MNPILQYLFYVVGLAGVLVVGKSNLKKQTIEDQSDLITTLQAENSIQAKQIDRLEKRVKFLEDLLYERAGMVDKGDTHRSRRQGRGNRPTSTALEDDE